MKCREMNPGNRAGGIHRIRDMQPSMKCREMNPGNVVSVAMRPARYGVPQ